MLKKTRRHASRPLARISQAVLEKYRAGASGGDPGFVRRAARKILPWRLRAALHALIMGPGPAAPFSPRHPAPAETAPGRPRLRPARAPAPEPRLAVFCMGRNESRMAHDFMRHLCIFFDQVVIIDHLSADDTGKIAAGYDGVNNTRVTVLRSAEPGYFPQEYMSALARAALRQNQTDWIFFLDFDEFLPFRNRGALRAALAAHEAEPIIKMPWCNIALAGPFAGSVRHLRGEIAFDSPAGGKIALNARLLFGHDLAIAPGSHRALLRDDPCAGWHEGAEAFSLLHLPIPDREKLQNKLSAGTESLAAARLAGGGRSRWEEMASVLAEKNIDDKSLRELALNYGAPLAPLLQRIAMGRFTPGLPVTLDPPLAPRADPAGEYRPPSLCLKNMDDLAARIFPEEQAPAVLDAPFPPYGSLSPHAAGACDLWRFFGREDADALGSATKSLLGRLLGLFPPRRFVEIGGWRFIPLALALRETAGIAVEAVSICDWPDSAPETPVAAPVECFSHFQTAFRNACPAGKFIRGIMEATALFAPKSIDVLLVHCSGEPLAAGKILESWRDRLGENCLLCLYDRACWAPMRPVAAIFDSLRGHAAASACFMGDGVLGLLAFGDARKNPLIPALHGLAAHGR